MTYSPTLYRLRFGLAGLYARQERLPATPGLHLLLPIPLPQRLILLAIIDGANERTIRGALACSPEDASLKSQRMIEALSQVKAILADPSRFWTEGNATDWTVVENRLGQLLWADVAVALIGQSVPPQVGRLSLRTRLIIYCLLVEGVSRNETIRIMGGTEWEIRRSLMIGLRAVNGGI